MRRYFFLLLRVSRHDLRLLGTALRHPARPAWLIPALIVLGLYALAPFNFVVPLVGVVDEFLIVPAALHLLAKLLPQALHSRTR